MKERVSQVPKVKSAVDEPATPTQDVDPLELERTVMQKLAHLATGEGASVDLLPVYKEILTRLGKLNGEGEAKPKPDKQILKRIQADILAGRLLVDD
jgi:hypothetical protein